MLPQTVASNWHFVALPFMVIVKRNEPVRFLAASRRRTRRVVMIESNFHEKLLHPSPRWLSFRSGRSRIDGKVENCHTPLAYARHRAVCVLPIGGNKKAFQTHCHRWRKRDTTNTQKLTKKRLYSVAFWACEFFVVGNLIASSELKLIPINTFRVASAVKSKKKTWWHCR